MTKGGKKRIEARGCRARKRREGWLQTGEGKDERFTYLIIVQEAVAVHVDVRVPQRLKKSPTWG
jgi:hypothetical protein